MHVSFQNMKWQTTYLQNKLFHYILGLQGEFWQV